MANPKIMLLSTGEEDKYLTGDPTDSFFKDSHKHHSNFSQRWSTIPKAYSTAPTQIPQEGDLLYNLWLVVDGVLRAPSQQPFSAGILDIIDTITIKCDDRVLQTIDYNFINIYNKINTNNNQFKQQIEHTCKPLSGDNTTVCLRLPFWFTKNPGSALPIWLLDKPNLTISLTFKSQYTHYGNNVDFIDVRYIAQWINLTSKEKDVFKNSSLEYLIEQVDIVNKENLRGEKSVKIDIPRSKFVKYLVWNVINKARLANSDLGRGANPNLNGESEPWIDKSTLSLDGIPVINDKGSYLTRITNRFTYFNSPNFSRSFDGSSGHLNDLHIHSHSFCTDPSKFQSTGFLTTDKYSNFTLEISRCSNWSTTIGWDPHLHVYVVRHNIMRIKDGVLNILHN